MANWYDPIVTNVVNALSSKHYSKTEVDNLLKKEKTKVVLIAPNILQKTENIDIKAMPIENNVITVGKKVYFYKED